MRHRKMTVAPGLARQLQMHRCLIAGGKTMQCEVPLGVGQGMDGRRTWKIDEVAFAGRRFSRRRNKRRVWNRFSAAVTHNDGHAHRLFERELDRSRLLERFGMLQLIDRFERITILECRDVNRIPGVRRSQACDVMPSSRGFSAAMLHGIWQSRRRSETCGFEASI